MTFPADAAWTALLPDGLVLPQSRGVAAAVLRGEFGRPSGIQAYLTVPSRHRPVIVARWDPGVLRYLADTVLSVPPGARPVISRLLTAGLPLLRHPATWILVAAVCHGGIVLVNEDP